VFVVERQKRWSLTISGWGSVRARLGDLGLSCNDQLTRWMNRNTYQAARPTPPIGNIQRKAMVSHVGIVGNVIVIEYVVIVGDESG
jgi:hypothetical protein